MNLEQLERANKITGEIKKISDNKKLIQKSIDFHEEQSWQTTEISALVGPNHIPRIKMDKDFYVTGMKLLLDIENSKIKKLEKEFINL